MFCIKCGKPLAEGALFCGFCGAKVVIPEENRAPAGSFSGSSGANPGGAQSTAANAGRYSVPPMGQNAYASYTSPNTGSYQAPRQGNRPGFDIAEFWKTHCAPILSTHNESSFMDPQKWYAGSAAGIPRDVLEKASSFIGGGSVLPDEIIALVIINPNVLRNAAGRIGFVFCRDRFCYKGSGYNPRDGYKGMLIGGPFYSLAKSAGRKSAAIRYADIASLTAHGEYLDVFLKQGGKQTLYLEEKFNPIRTKAVFDELLFAMRG